MISRERRLKLLTRDWDALPDLPESAHAGQFLEIMRRHDQHPVKPVPLRGRYTRGRRWSGEEFESCFNAWRKGKSLTFIAAALNRNPQDMIYKLLDRCEADGIRFTQEGRSEGSGRWTDRVAQCAEELFDAGLPAWKIAATFRVDFEHVEKALFKGRSGYGHKKKNPFTICTDHKVLVNDLVLGSFGRAVSRALDAFAGEGRTTALLTRHCPGAEIHAVELDGDAWRESQVRDWPDRVSWHHKDNISFLKEAADRQLKFDLVDLDPFVSCHEQVPLIWPLLAPNSLVFVTFGGEYRRSFIGSNRKAIRNRYGFSDFELGNSEYLEVVPFFFFGWLAKQAADAGFTVRPIRAVRYANFCRYWTEVQEVGRQNAAVEFETCVTAEKGGWRWRKLSLPRFKEVRWEIDEARSAQMQLL